MKRLTQRRFRRLKHPFEIDDVVFLPSPTVTVQQIERTVDHYLRTGELRHCIPGEVWEKIFDPDARVFFLHLHEFCETRWFHRRHDEFDWIDRLPPPLPGYLRRQLAPTGYEALAICQTVPNTGMAYIVKEDGLVEEVLRVAPLGRLGGIRQLGFLTTPTLKDRGSQTVPQRFNHTRYGHSLDVMALATLVGWNLGLRGKELHTLRAAGLVHDLATPAGGDTTKMIDEPHVFDEERNLRALLETCDWSRIQNRYGITVEDVLDVIEGRNRFLNQALDVADKCGYIARDVQQYMWGNPSDFPHPLTSVATEVIALNPYSCTLWENVLRRGSEVVFLNPEQLAAFLKLRVLMFRCLYYNPDARFLEFVIAKVILQYLYETGAVTVERLLVMRDEELQMLVEAFVETPWVELYAGPFGTPRCETFDNLDDALRREQELLQETPFTVIERFGRVIKPTTHWKVRHGARFLPLEEAHPELTAEIHALAHMADMHIVFWIEDPHLPPKVLTCLEAHRTRVRQTGQNP